MCGWSRLAAASASVRKRRTSCGGRELAGQDHLQGHDAVEADLPGLVDDAHAAAGDLLQQLVIAEVADGAQRRGNPGGRLAGSSVGAFARRRRDGGPPHPVVVGEERAQGLGQLRVPGKQLLPVGGLPASTACR